MNDENRLLKISKVRSALASGHSETIACRSAGVSVAWFRRWNEQESLADSPRPGRPASCEVTAEDAQVLREHYLRSNRGRNAGSMSAAARWCAVHGLVSPSLAETLLKNRSDLCRLPAPVVRVFRNIGEHEFAKYRDPKKGMGKSDGIRTPGWLRMNEDGGGRLEPGQRWVFDDGSVNVGIVVPWTRGGDTCSEKFGVRVARFQLLLATDCATDAITGYSFVMNANDSYGAADITAAMYGIWAKNGEAPREVVLEGGSWQAEKTLRFLRLAGVRVISAKGDPGQKLVESVFNRLWTILSLALPAQGQIGRVRGEMKKETQQWLDCRAGKKDPREYFPTLLEFLTALRKAMLYHNAKPVTSRIYGQWVPEAKYMSRRPEAMLPVPASLRREALPVDKVVTLKRSGCASVRCLSPHGLPHDYVFADESLYRYGQAKVRVQFDPMNIREGAFITLGATWRGEPEGKVLSERAACISSPPVVELAAIHGYADGRADARALKKASRAQVVASVAALDERGKFKRDEVVFEALPPQDSRTRLPDLSPEPEAPVESDFAALETAAGIW